MSMSFLLVALPLLPISGPHTDGGGGGGGWLSIEVAKLTASNQWNLFWFGNYVAVSGNTAVVCAPGESNPGNLSGVAYIFDRDLDGGWTQVQRLTREDCPDGLGGDVAIDGRTMLIAAGPGSTASVHVLEPDSTGKWALVAVLTSPIGSLTFGTSLAVCDDTVVVGDSNAQPNFIFNAGAAYVFERDQGGPGNWGQVVEIPGTVQDRFGTSIALHADRLVVGSEFTSNSKGAAWVFDRHQGGPNAWGQVAKLTLPNPSGSDDYGKFVAVSGDVVLVAAPLGETAGLTNNGVVHVYERDQGGGAAWGQAATLSASDAESFELFGFSVAMSGTRAVIGAHRDTRPGLPDAGSVYVFDRDWNGPGTWAEVTKLTASDASDSDWYGYDVALSGSTVLVGARFDDATSGFNGAGSAYVHGVRPPAARAWALSWLPAVGAASAAGIALSSVLP